MSTRLHALEINGRPASELLLAAYGAALVGLPVLFVAGDEATCAEAQGLDPGIVTFAVKRGVGGATVSLAAEEAVAGIRDGVAAALERDPHSCRIALPETFAVEVTYREHPAAYRAACYPRAFLRAPRTVGLETSDFMEVLRFLLLVA